MDIEMHGFISALIWINACKPRHQRGGFLAAARVLELRGARVETKKQRKTAENDHHETERQHGFGS